MSKQDESAPYCEGSRCRPEGMGLRQDAMDFGNYATATFIGAGVCLAAGTTLLFLDSDPAQGEPTTASVSVVATPGLRRPFGGLQVRVGGTF